MIKIYTDGSCLSNPGAGGWAAVIIDDQNRREEIFGGEEYTTNNRMELTAALRALEKTPAGAYVEIFTDSSYLKNAFASGWLAKWKVNGWKTANKKPVLNRDLWLELDAVIAARDVTFNWVKGHAGNRLNERCDTLARRFAEQIQRGTIRLLQLSEPEVSPQPEVSPPRSDSPSETSAPLEVLPQPKVSPPRRIRKPPKSSPAQLSLFDL